MNEKIFKAYDIRGLYPEDINEAGAYQIGRAVAAYTGAKTIAVGIDMRTSSPSLEAALVRGIVDQGTDVIKIGLATTPLVYFSSWKLDVDAGIIITASHNPAQYNGMKLCRRNAVPIGEGEGMEEIKKLAIAGIFSNPAKLGTVSENNNLHAEYLAYMTNFFKKGLGKKKVVIDFANGMGIADKAVYDALSSDIESVPMYDCMDGNFPNHEANPLKTETLEALQQKVIEEKADLGIAYDGDADRVGFVDEKGEVVPMDFITALIAKEVLKKYPGGMILMDLRSSNAVREMVEAAGGRTALSRVGHSLIKKQMRAQNAVFAGELSGHYYFEENSYGEMSTLAVIMILNLLNETDQKMSALTADLKKYFRSGEINSEVSDKQAVFSRIKEQYAAGTLNELDGLRIDFPDWWFNVRASNTEPVIRLNVEATSQTVMVEKRDELLSLIRMQ